MDIKGNSHPRNIFGSASFIVVDVDALQLKVRLTSVGARGVDAVLIAEKGKSFQPKSEICINKIPASRYYSCIGAERVMGGAS